jgi:hypothetical protein
MLTSFVRRSTSGETSFCGDDDKRGERTKGNKERRRSDRRLTSLFLGQLKSRASVVTYVDLRTSVLSSGSLCYSVGVFFHR